MFETLFAVCLLVDDLEKSVRFYSDVLGLKVKDTDEGFTNFQLQGAELAVFERRSAVNMFPAKYMRPAGGAVLGFQVEDVDDACRTLAEKGVSVFEGPKTTPWGQRVAYVHDPDGYVWEISSK